MGSEAVASPKGASRLDEVTRFVQSRLGGRVWNLGVEQAVNGRVVLQGRTTTYYVKQLAQHVAQDALGSDVELDNAIVVT